jgi:hypothetical protein
MIVLNRTFANHYTLERMVVVKPILLLCRFAAGALFFLMMLPAVHDKAWVSAAFLSTAFVTTVYPDSAFRLSWGKRIAIILAAFILGVWFLPDSYDYAWKSAR